jgi:hypothetical protein
MMASKTNYFSFLDGLSFSKINCRKPTLKKAPFFLPTLLKTPFQIRLSSSHEALHAPGQVGDGHHNSTS